MARGSHETSTRIWYCPHDGSRPPCHRLVWHAIVDRGGRPGAGLCGLGGLDAGPANVMEDSVDFFEILFLSLFVGVGIHSFFAYRRKPTRANRMYLIVCTMCAVVIIAGAFVLRIPDLSAFQRELIRKLFASWFVILVLFWLIGGAIGLYLQYWKKYDE